MTVTDSGSLFDSNDSDCQSQSRLVSWNIKILQMFHERSIQELKERISEEKVDYSYTCSKIPFSGNSEVIDLE